MNICVCIKQVPDTETKIKITPDGAAIDTTGIKWVMNPYDEFAVEEALKIREGRGQGTVTVISVGPARVADALRTALAMGADEAIQVTAPEGVGSATAAKALAAAIQKLSGVELVLAGKLAIDDNQSAVPQMVAELLGWTHASVVSKLEVKDSGFIVEREVEGGEKHVLSLGRPAVISANKGLNMPRYASLPGIMKAKKKPLQEMSLDSLGLADGAGPKFSGFQLPAEKPPVKMVTGANPSDVCKDLVQLLRTEAKVI